jgi:ribbon-helix-helix protein
MRITACIDESYEQKLKATQQRTRLNTTEILEQALDLLYEKTELTGKEKNRLLIKKLAGTGKGPEDGSINYKEYVAEYLDEKFGYR